MKVLVEALALEFGGIRTYVENLLHGWSRAHSADELLVVTARGADLDTGAHQRWEVSMPRPEVLGRAWRHTGSVRRLARTTEADVVVATLPSTSLVGHEAPVAVVVHDLRHELRPDQFSNGRRLLRRLAYGQAYRVADGFVCVSGRTRDDLQRLHPELRATPTTVVHHGADHVLRWPRLAPARSGPAITFAHHNNKNPGLVIEAWARATSAGLNLPDLWVLGSRAEGASLAATVRRVGMEGRVHLRPFLPDPDFRAALTAASLVILPSDFEGFGLPVLEAMALEIPVVIGPDPAVLEVAGRHATVMEDWSVPDLATALERALEMAADPRRLGAALTHARSYTWERTAQRTRTFLAGLVDAADSA